MRSNRITFLTFLLLISLTKPTLAGVKVLKAQRGVDLIAISADTAIPLDLNQYICLWRKSEAPSKTPKKKITKRKRVTCGRVIRLTDKGTIVAVDDLEHTLQVTENLEVEVTDREPSAETTTLNIIDTPFDERYQWRNVSVGFNLLSLNARIEQMLLRWGAAGIMPAVIFSQSAGSGTVSGLGAYLTGSIYPMGPMTGLWGLVALGGFTLTAKTDVAEERAIAGAALAAVGWRWRYRTGMNIGIAAGAQYMILPKLQTVTLNSNGVNPVLQLEVAYSF